MAHSSTKNLFLFAQPLVNVWVPESQLRARLGKNRKKCAKEQSLKP